MVSGMDNPSVTCYPGEQAKAIKANSFNNIRVKFDFCPCCDRKGYYKISRRYEHCRLCGYHRILLPGQDF